MAAPSKKTSRKKAPKSPATKSKTTKNRASAVNREKKKTGSGLKSSIGQKAAKAAKGSPAPRKRGAATRKPKLRYKQGQEIVYPLQGVGQIVSIEERAFRATRLLYYIIYLEVSDMTIMVPVDKADELGIRPIVDKREANKALRLISEDYEPVPTDWKARYQNNLDLLKKGSVLDIATVVRALYHRSRIKELPILERKLYDSALKLLVDEISFSLQKGKEEVEELVLSKLNVN
jgi:CarD family transcriptional regulator